MGIKDRQRKRERKKDTGHPGRELHQHVCGLRAENIFRNSPAKCRTKALALRALHQNYEHHEQRHENEERQEQIDQEVHRDGQYQH